MNFSAPRPTALLLIATLLASTVPLQSAYGQAADEGIVLEKPSRLKNLVPAEQLERSAAQQFAQMKRQASEKNALAPDDHPQLIRLRTISKRLLPHISRWNSKAANWQWEVQLFGSNAINAFCMPGGKIGFYMGILDRLKLTDDEVAMVMGHEIAHALREHSRERLAKNQLTGIGAGVLSSVLGLGDVGRTVMDYGAQLTMLKFSRDDESEADLIGLDLAARAGFDPRAGVTLWRKMSAASKNSPPQWLSTHPSGNNRIAEIERHLDQVLPLYAKAIGKTLDTLPPDPSL
ncbi:MAG: M48 family metallopeptidase [Burkholderiaceae bacterium]|nr:M48 family metallopeptidase [Burkholderiaceae bacterium]